MYFEQRRCRTLVAAEAQLVSPPTHQNKETKLNSTPTTFVNFNYSQAWSTNSSPIIKIFPNPTNKIGINDAIGIHESMLTMITNLIAHLKAIYFAVGGDPPCNEAGVQKMVS